MPAAMTYTQISLRKYCLYSSKISLQICALRTSNLGFTSINEKDTDDNWYIPIQTKCRGNNQSNLNEISYAISKAART